MPALAKQCWSPPLALSWLLLLLLLLWAGQQRSSSSDVPRQCSSCWQNEPGNSQSTDIADEGP